jgi:hypothetical protein
MVCLTVFWCERIGYNFFIKKEAAFLETGRLPRCKKQLTVRCD